MSGVDEIRAPPPVDSTTDRPRHGQPTSELHLEDQSPGDRSFQVDEEPPKHSREPVNHARHAAKPSHLLIQLYIISHLTLFSLLGTLARLGIQWVTTYPGAPVTISVLWANIGGSYVMGFLSEDRRLFQFPTHLSKPSMSTSDRKALHSKHKKTIPLYIGLATGFCGSFTSFSSFIRDAFLALSNDLPASLYHPVVPGVPSPRFSSTHPRNAGYSLPALLAVLITEPALSLSALYVGAHTALLLDKYTPSLPASASRVLDPLAIPLGLGAWLATMLIAIFPTNSDWRGEVLFALVFAPLGTLIRYFVSLQLNPRAKSFPVGTFAVNILGSAVLGMAWDLQRVRIGGIPGGGVVGCQVLQGIEDGFCGCLTTVSTWVAEIQGLRRGHAYRYALVSVGVGLATMVVVMGSVRWSVGWETPVCVTGRTSV